MEQNPLALDKFVNDPGYRKRVIDYFCVKPLEEHGKKLSIYRAQLAELTEQRRRVQKKGHKRKDKGSWEKLYGGKLMIDRTTGLVRINNCIAKFSDISDARINMQEDVKIVVVDNRRLVGRQKTSIRGTILGGIAGGFLGAALGGLIMGHTEYVTEGRVYEQRIPMCTHLGVLVKVNGRIMEIRLISSPIKKAAMRVKNATAEAKLIVNTLNSLSKFTVLGDYRSVDDDRDVRGLDIRIYRLQRQLQEAVKSGPNIKLPDIYRLPELGHLSDREYIKYLYSMDAKRKNEERRKNDDENLELF